MGHFFCCQSFIIIVSIIFFINFIIFIIILNCTSEYIYGRYVLNKKKIF